MSFLSDSSERLREFLLRQVFLHVCIVACVDLCLDHCAFCRFFPPSSVAVLRSMHLALYFHRPVHVSFRPFCPNVCVLTLRFPSAVLRAHVFVVQLIN